MRIGKLGTTVFAAGVVALCLAVAAPVRAAVITIDFDVEYSEGTPPSGPAPWMRATFEDVGLDTVRLTLSTFGLLGTEFVGAWYFSLDPALNPALLSFVDVDDDPDWSVFSRGADAYQAGPGGKYDIKIDYPQGPPASRFGALEEASFDLSMAGLDAADFLFIAAPGGGKPSFHAAAHVQSIGPQGESGWVGGSPGGGSVPEPTLLSLLGLGLAGIAYKSRRA